MLTPTPAPLSSQLLADAPFSSGQRQAASLQKRVYTIRSLLAGMTLILLAATDLNCRQSPLGYLWLYLFGIAYPHLGHLLLGRLDIRKRRGQLLFLADGLFAGAVASSLDFASVATIALVSINLFNWIVIGGPILVILGCIALFVGALSSGWSELSSIYLASCGPPMWMAGAILICYPLVVGFVIHKFIAELRREQNTLQNEKTAATNARILAEQALLATLPPSLSKQLQEGRNDRPLHFEAATQLLIVLSRKPAALGTENQYIDFGNILDACEAILTRHGFETIKTFGRHVLAFHAGESGLDAAVSAVRELDAYLDEHRLAPNAQAHACRMHAILHHGPATLLLAQSGKLNPEMFCEEADTLFRIAADTREADALLVVSTEAHARLIDPVGFTFTPVTGDVEPGYFLAKQAIA
jgi:hypothetical protein